MNVSEKTWKTIKTHKTTGKFGLFDVGISLAELYSLVPELYVLLLLLKNQGLKKKNTCLYVKLLSTICSYSSFALDSYESYLSSLHLTISLAVSLTFQKHHYHY